MASQRKKTCYFGEEALRACATNCSAFRDVWELSLLMVWALIATQVPPGLLLPYWTQDLLITVQEVTASYFSSADRSFFLLSHKENLFKYLLYFFFCTGDSSSLVLLAFFFFFLFNIIGCPDNIFQAQKIFVVSHCGDTHKWASVSVIPDDVASAYVVCNLSTSESFCAFQCHSNLQHLPNALK